MKRIIPVIVFLMFISSCDTFIGKKKTAEIKQLESFVYLTLTDITAGQRSLPKGSMVNIRIRTNKDWIKVYGFPLGSDELHSQQVLILYMFKEEFEKEKFSEDLFKTKLDEKLKKVE